MKSTCPKVADTRWLSLGQVSKWLLDKYIPLSDYLELKNPACTPPPQWWVYLSVVTVVMVDRINVIFKRLQVNDAGIAASRKFGSIVSRFTTIVLCPQPYFRSTHCQ